MKTNWLTRTSHGTLRSPPKILIFGQPGVGKSTLATDAPRSITIQGEVGTEQINCSRIDPPESWQDACDQVEALITEEHDYETVVLDTLDGLEGLLFRDICHEARAKSIEYVGGGYGKGFTRAVEKWREMLLSLERLRAKRGMGVVLVAHATVKMFANPEGADYDRWIPRMNERSWGAIYGWCDAALFAHYRVANTESDSDKKGKAVADGTRWLRCAKSAAVEAKNRYGMPDLVPLVRDGGWASSIAPYLDAPLRVRAEIETLLEQATPELGESVRRWLATANANATELQAGLDRLRNRIKETA
jgi:hypothetical protein